METTKPEEVMKTLKCNRCKLVKPCTSFHKRLITRGYQYVCKECYHSDVTTGFVCSCGINLSYRNNKSRHIKTNSHARKIKEQGTK